ncbi:DUF2268 domain-containing protein [Candidatus Enterococcus clewellii]|uniref:DUF2268 domain-containing protein n=1 Tax=Candidatus Enterococcus clewellii TaxID=1834193 RepID=A0A242K4K8_9ENTE|nr:DUF2268 domain-containing protein [Enterococcus sp. 9E7_DIV0242]OTP14460.1 hypothetical protein A5888_002561 [Enterococcus sp. 9E7_DIV0242]
MNTIKITTVDTLSFYNKCVQGNSNEDGYRYELMKPLEKMWQYLNAPMTPKTPGGYDVVMASEMLGIWTPRKDVRLIEAQIDPLKQTGIFEECTNVLTTGIQRFSEIGYPIPVEEFTLAILLGDPENKILMASEGYSGFGGIPGYMLLLVFPTAFNKTRLKSALAHEFNHNIRFTYEPFNHGDVSVEDYLVIEGLAEVFAEQLYGIEQRGPWVQDYDEEEMAYTIEVIKDGREARGFDQVAAYMYGDEVAREQGYSPVGLSRNAGYTIGYHIVKEYLKNTGQTIEQATLTPSKTIVEKSRVFA